MLNGCMEFYDLGEKTTRNQQTTSEQSSQAGTIDQRQQAEEPNIDEVRNDVAAAIQYTQNEDGTMRVINDVNGLIEEIKQQKEHYD